MKHIKDPRQKQLFDPFERLFSPLARKTIQNGWQGLFREVILELLPAQIIAGEFDPDTGRPTKELCSVAGLLLIAEFMDWNRPLRHTCIILMSGTLSILSLVSRV